MYGSDNVTVTAEWVQQRYVSYSVDITPWAHINFIEDSRILVTLSYNTKYNLSVKAVAPCRNDTTTSIGIHYGKTPAYNVMF